MFSAINIQLVDVLSGMAVTATRLSCVSVRPHLCPGLKFCARPIILVQFVGLARLGPFTYPPSPVLRSTNLPLCFLRNLVGSRLFQ